MRLKQLLFLILSAFCPLFMSGQELLPFVENFTKSEYFGDNQVWSISQGSDYSMYFANNNYLLRYDGAVWQKKRLPNKTIIRSVFAVENRVYCGSYNEFGYWFYEKGQLTYTSLSAGKNLFKGNTLNEEIWKIFSHEGKIYFQSFNSIFIYDGKLIKAVKLPFQISYCFIVGSEIWFASTNKGIYRYVNGTFENLELGTILNNNIVHHAANNQGTDFIFTLKNGVYCHKEGTTKPWNHSLNQRFKRELILCAKFLSKNRLAVGTASNGLYIIDLNDGSYKNISRENGLCNNSVLQIQTDLEGDLWLGLDNGISHIEINSNFQFFTDVSGKLGSVYALNKNNDEVLIGSNHGLFSYKQKKLELIPNSQGQVWSIEPFGSAFAIGHNDGTFRYEQNRIKRVNTVTGGWKFLPDVYQPLIFQSHYAGIIAYQSPLNLEKFLVINGLTKPIKNLVQSKPGQLWAADAYRGIYRIDYEYDNLKFTITDISKLQNFKNDFSVKLLSFRESVYVKIADKWYTPNKKTNLLNYDSKFTAAFRGVTELAAAGKESLLAVKNTQLYLVRLVNDSFVWDLIPEKYYRGRLINQDTKIFTLGSKYAVNLDDGFLEFTEQKNTRLLDNISIEAFQQQKCLQEGSVVGYKRPVELRILHKYFGQNTTEIYYRRNGDEIKAVPYNNRLILNNLESGDQQIEFFSIQDNNFTRVAIFEFEVARPWFLSGYMLVIYACALALLLFLYYKWNQFRYKQQIAIREEEIKHQSELRNLELEAQNALRIQEYEKHILEMQIQAKASEVASKSLAIAKHSEIIEAVSAAVEEEPDVTKLKTKIKKAIKNHSITQKEWEHFEQNLLQSHAEFVKKITENYPILTSKDIKLAIYLKMNLSSKEIAPLMNITYRGVEIHRYRLRKKLALDAEVSLNRFMNTL